MNWPFWLFVTAAASCAVATFLSEKTGKFVPFALTAGFVAFAVLYH